ncbi:MAG TPA: stage II sporulation protein P [Candidatus Cryosericum sp.]|nr:stage II sporulation protein P [Candidatus Cryosericum sp.]
MLITIPPSPTASPTPEPEMTIDEDGDITLRSDIAEQFSADAFPFDHTPVVLIYHTHATESYLWTENAGYTETERGRTEDKRFNVVAVGAALQKALEERGFTVIHDTADVEGEDITSAYSRSLQIMQKYENVDLYIDLHRNSSSQRGRSENTILVDSVPYAKLFFVVGTGIGTYDGEYDILPDWKNNYTFALSLTEAITAKQPDLVKPIRLKVGRFNQHMGLCLLAEIGTNADTLEAALNTLPYLADAIVTVCTQNAGQG